MGTTLIVTNDFPPRQGGIETFVHAMAMRVPGHDVVVHTSAEPGAAAFDATLPFPVVRDRARTLLPTRRVTEQTAELVRAYGCDRVWFGAAAPLALMAPALRRAGAERLVATTHGHEIWWARVPGARRLLRRVGEGVDVVTYLGEYTRSRIAPALGPQPRARLSRLVPGVDAAAFRPDPVPGPASADPADAGLACAGPVHVDPVHPDPFRAAPISLDPARDAPSRADRARAVRDRHRLHGRTVVLCVARLVPRKGQDALIRALPLIRSAVPEAILLIVGQGPDERRLRRLAAQLPEGSVEFAGGRSHAELPGYYAAADLFAMPCRTRRAGLEAEGLGIVYLEAAASGLPVVAGDSGGAPDAVLDGRTGVVVDGRDVRAVAEAVIRLLGTPEGAAMGRAGRRWAAAEWSWDGSAARLERLLTPGGPLPADAPSPGRSSSRGPLAPDGFRS
ncbi:glycosyltransferase family 4 protein [Kitasatospora sp. NPDC096147]|uniref:glycosyltransferase family 4 protein n=1 Tax=Kitasatospora sp. NPDC096147 TaxID=3364093 RepID=UPI00380EFD6C